MWAIVDTGSDICAIRYDMLFLLGDFDLDPAKKSLVGTGGRVITTIGNFNVRIEVDEIELDVTFHVVREGDILYSAVLGNDIFDHVDWVIDGGNAQFRKRQVGVKREGADSVMKDGPIECVESELSAVGGELSAGKIDDLRREFGDIVLSAAVEETSEEQLELEHLEHPIHEQVRSMVAQYKPTKPEEYPVKMKLILKDEIPVSQTPRRLPYSDQMIK